jgi:hypothetical protein
MICRNSSGSFATLPAIRRVSSRGRALTGCAPNTVLSFEKRRCGKSRNLLLVSGWGYFLRAVTAAVWRHVHVHASVVRYRNSSWCWRRFFSSHISRLWSGLSISGRHISRHYVPRDYISGRCDVSASRIISAVVPRVCDRIAARATGHRRFTACRETVLRYR